MNNRFGSLLRLPFLTGTWLYLFLAFPLLDYLLRNWLPVPVISSLWDEGVLAVLVVITLFQMLGSERELPAVKVPMLAFVLLGVAHIVIDLPYFAAGLEGFRAVFQYMLAFFIGFYLVKNEQDALSYLRFIALLGTLAALVGIAQVALGVETPAGWTDASEQGLTRAFSFVVSPNVLGSYLALIAPLCFGLFLYEREKLWKWGWLVCTPVVLVALVFTGSRGAWLALFAAILIYLVAIDRRLLIAGIIGAAGAVAFVSPIRSRMLNLFSAEYLEKSSNDGRIARWLGAYEQMSYEPLFGKGIGHYGGAVADRYFGTNYVDSYYFKTLAEMGLTGIVLFLWLMLSVSRLMYAVWQQWKGQPGYYLLGGLFTGLLAVLLHNGVENIFEVPFMNSYFWFLCGLVLAFRFFKKGGSHA
ncbi:O-antigen ligase family protein [Desulfolucanica intricata]|uniref:O-antigen ligase family protein n=1 Tax=Desulfolucanica intricata TaxID=1285191 RepID=UPI000829B4A8|nr:O-antigen ligase family protein [Desulfolucanica intricata]